MNRIISNDNKQESFKNEREKEQQDREKKRTKRIIYFILILLPIVVAIILTYSISGLINSEDYGMNYIGNKANNYQYELLLGENVSSSDIKSLLNLVRNNNLTASMNSEGTIAIHWKGNLCTPNDVLLEIKGRKKYEAYIDNNKKNDILPIIDGTINSKNKGSKANNAYYSNGNFRIITIVEK